MIKAQKVDLVKDLVAELKDAKSVVLVNYTGLSVKSQQALKTKLNEANGRMVVVKNTLLKRAIEEAKLTDTPLASDVLTGQTAIVIATDDALAPIQALGKFAKENELPKFKVGVVEGAFQDTQSLLKLSTLPGRDALLGQLLGSLMSNLYGLVGTLQNPLQTLVYTLDRASKKG